MLVSYSSKLLGMECLSKTITFLTNASNVIESLFLKFFKSKMEASVLQSL